jgi:hypothetical protein
MTELAKIVGAADEDATALSHEGGVAGAGRDLDDGVGVGVGGILPVADAKLVCNALDIGGDGDVGLLEAAAQAQLSVVAYSLWRRY